MRHSNGTPRRKEQPRSRIQCWIRYSRPGWRGMDLAILREQAERPVNNLAPSPYTGVRTTVDTLIDPTHIRATGDPGQVTRSIFTGGELGISTVPFGACCAQKMSYPQPLSITA